MPLFPLPVVLFPGAPLPLHIFEPRYQQLLADCLEDDRSFGITPPGEGDAPPAPGAVGCTAVVKAHQQLDDGRSNIVVVGGARFTVSGYVETSLPYAVALVSELEDGAGTRPTDEAAAELRFRLARYVRLYRELHEAGEGELDVESEPVALSFQAAAAIQAETDVKQHLLAIRSTAERVEQLLSLLDSLSTDLERSLRVHRGARGNGRGGSHSDIIVAE